MTTHASPGLASETMKQAQEKQVIHETNSLQCNEKNESDILAPPAEDDSKDQKLDKENRVASPADEEQLDSKQAKAKDDTTTHASPELASDTMKQGQEKQVIHETNSLQCNEKNESDILAPPAEDDSKDQKLDKESRVASPADEEQLDSKQAQAKDEKEMPPSQVQESSVDTPQEHLSRRNLNMRVPPPEHRRRMNMRGSPRPPPQHYRQGPTPPSAPSASRPLNTLRRPPPASQHPKPPGSHRRRTPPEGYRRPRNQRPGRNSPRPDSNSDPQPDSTNDPSPSTSSTPKRLHLDPRYEYDPRFHPPTHPLAKLYHQGLLYNSPSHLTTPISPTSSEPDPESQRHPPAQRVQRPRFTSNYCYKTNLKPRFEGDMSHRPLETLVEEECIALDNTSHRIPLDCIDLLDTANGRMHHEGPYDPALRARNRNRKTSPLAAVYGSNMEALRATPAEYIEDSLRKHVPLQGTGSVPSGQATNSGQKMEYEEDPAVIIENYSPFNVRRRWEGPQYQPDDPDYRSDSEENNKSLNLRNIFALLKGAKGPESADSDKNADKNNHSARSTGLSSGKRMAEGLKKRFRTLSIGNKAD